MGNRKYQVVYCCTSAQGQATVGNSAVAVDNPLSSTVIREIEAAIAETYGVTNVVITNLIPLDE